MSSRNATRGGLEPRPCALLPRGDHDAVDRVRLEAALALVSRDRVQGRILHDATDVEYHRRDRAHGRAPWNIANSRLRYRAGGARYRPSRAWAPRPRRPDELLMNYYG